MVSLKARTLLYYYDTIWYFLELCHLHSFNQLHHMKIYKENTPLQENDVFVLIDSCNNGFNYPIHNHPEIEINLVLGMSGHRIVGDSSEQYTNNDLVLLGPYLYHKWYGEEGLLNENKEYRVITIQFDANQFNNRFFNKDSFQLMVKLFKDSVRGIQYTAKTFEKAAKLMIEMSDQKGFDNTLSFLKLLDIFSNSNDTKFLSSAVINNSPSPVLNNRIQIAYNYIFHHYLEENFKMHDVANELNLSESAFSHYFHKYAFRSFSEFITDLKLGHACKLLISTDNTVSQVCYSSGFNNVANFNRLFKKYRLLTPNEYRENYNNEIKEFDLGSQSTPWQFVPVENKVNKVIKPVKFNTRIVRG